METVTFVTFIDTALKNTFIYQDILVIFFLGLIMLILAAKGADRISSIFIITSLITALAITGILSQDILYGLILIIGGILVAKTGMQLIKG